MGHSISIFLVKKSELRDSKIDSIISDQKPDNINWVELPEGILTTLHIPNFWKFIKGKTVAKIETDYFGGAGHQEAKLFVNGEKVYDKSSDFVWNKRPINTVLKMMGVEKKDGKDEFDTIGLSNYRSNQDFIF